MVHSKKISSYQESEFFPSFGRDAEITYAQGFKLPTEKLLEAERLTKASNPHIL